MTRIECPSAAWDRYCDDEERSQSPTDDELLDALDAYGHITWSVGFDDDCRDGGDWLACFDFKVVTHPDRGVLVAYHVVVNSDSGGFIDTPESAVVEVAKAPFNLPDQWLGIGYEVGEHVWTEKETAEAAAANTNWNDSLRAAIERSGEGGDCSTCGRPMDVDDTNDGVICIPCEECEDCDAD